MSEQGESSTAEIVAATLAQLCKHSGDLKGLLVLTVSDPELVYEDTYVAGIDEIEFNHMTLRVPARTYATLANEVPEIEQRLNAMVEPINDSVSGIRVTHISITARMEAEPGWRLAAEAFLAGKGVSNQGRVRSDNPAPYEHRGLYFRSTQEILLCDALLNRGVPFAPLAVFLKGDGTYGRIEPDFVILFKGKLFIVEVDGASHFESPVDAQERVQFLLEHKAEVKRVRASDCDTFEKAKKTADDLIRYFQKRSS